VAQNNWYPTWKEILQMGLTFLLTVLAWISFRAEDIGQAWQIYQGIFNASLFQLPELDKLDGELLVIIMISILIIIEWIFRKKQFALEDLDKHLGIFSRYLVYCLVFLVIVFYRNFENSIEFIYFQF